MDWITQLSGRRAVLIALAWPVGLAVLGPMVLKIYSFPVRWQGDGAGTYFVRIRIVSLAALAAIMFIPPLVFLGLWRARRP